MVKSILIALSMTLFLGLLIDTFSPNDFMSINPKKEESGKKVSQVQSSVHVESSQENISVRSNIKPEESREENSNESATSEFTDQEICKGVISLVMGYDIKDVDPYSTDSHSQTIYLQHRNFSDNSMSRYKCQAYRTRAHWGNADGRWRTESYDPEVIFELSATNQLLVREQYSDGSSRHELFSKEELK